VTEKPVVGVSVIGRGDKLIILLDVEGMCGEGELTWTEEAA
jgi:hypothetical protein